jgi:hypothetical protein
MRMRHTARHYNIFQHYFINDTIFEKKLLNVKRVSWFSVQLLSETFLILRRTERDVTINVYRSAACKVPVILVRLQWNLDSLYIFSKNSQISNFMKIHPFGDKLFHADRRTDMTKLTVACRNFANAPKTWISYYNEKLCDISSSPHITWLMTSLRMIWRWHVSRVRERRKTYGLSVGKPKGKRPLGGRPRRRWEDNIKIDLHKI